MDGEFFFNFDSEKNNKLILKRGISFEEIISAIENGAVVDILEHSNNKKYPNQNIYVLNIDDYIYLVPFVTHANEIFLKTIFPSRKLTKKYLGK